MAEICKPPMPVAEDEDEIVHYEIIADTGGEVWEPFDTAETEQDTFSKQNYSHTSEDESLKHAEHAEMAAQAPYYSSSHNLEEFQEHEDTTKVYYPTQPDPKNASLYAYHDKLSEQQDGVNVVTTEVIKSDSIKDGQTNVMSHCLQPLSHNGMTQCQTVPSINQVQAQHGNIGTILTSDKSIGQSHIILPPSTQHMIGTPDSQGYCLESITPFPDTVHHVTAISPSVTVISYAPQHVPPQSVHQLHESQLGDYQKFKDILIEPTSSLSQPTLQNNPMLISEDLKAAVTCGRVYGPDKAAYVPGEVVKHANMQTLYDSDAVPTFETELEVFAMPTLPLQKKNSEIIEPMETVAPPPVTVSGTGILKKAHQARRRMYCC